jgi:hypothetical protein
MHAKQPVAPPRPAAVTPPEPAPALHIPAPPQTPADAADQRASTPPAQPNDTKMVALPPLIPVKATVVSTPESAADDALAKVRELHRLAAQQIADVRMDSYIMRLKRREVVQGRRKPEEIILVKFRKEPFSVYLKWLGNEAKDREVIYVKGRYDNLIHTKVAAGDILLMPAGKRFSLPPDSILTRSNSRHPITNAGLGHLVDQFGELVAAASRHDPRLGTIKYLGVLNRPEFDTPVEGVIQMLVPGNDPLLPGGGRHLWFFDTKSHLPVLLISHDERQQEVEYYCHDRIMFPVGLVDDDFDPDKLWGKQR